MSTLRSPRIATEQALRELFPSLRGVAENSAEMRRLEQEYAPPGAGQPGGADLSQDQPCAVGTR